MQAAITWAEEEESQMLDIPKPSTRVRVVSADAEQASSTLTLEKLHEAIQKIATRQDELYQAVHGNGRAQFPQNRPKRQPLKDNDGRYICYSCGEPGHTSRRCSLGVEAAKVTDQSRSSTGMAGTNIGSVPSSTAQTSLTAANGLDIPVLGCLQADIECMGKVLPGKCIFVLKDTSQQAEEIKGLSGIIGMNIISEFKSVFVTGENVKSANRYGQPAEAKIRKVLASVEKTETLSPDGKLGFVKVGGKQAITIPPLSEKVFEGRCRVPPKVKCQVLIEPTTGVSLPKGLLVANVLTKTEGGKVSVRVMNSSKQTIRLNPRCRVAVVSKPQEVLTENTLEFEEEEGALHVRRVTHVQAVEVSDKPPVPVQVNCEKLTPAQGEELNQLLEKRLNQVTCKDAYPLPRVEESLDALGNAQLFSTLDLTAGYFQVAVSERDREKTAVTTPFGLFEWTRIPFGLSNAPATFQRLMGVVLGDLTFDVLLVYLDDIIVFSKDFRSHCERLELVFGRLKRHGLKLKPSCHHLSLLTQTSAFHSSSLQMGVNRAS
ncbi:hypothetical protein DPEC_G00002700 [Dallia pectoralis]|uniref:Uncharacterized protein n=1 Tax=Dallia pectoralis TaxID=75939 RepID=A0ACC2HJJ6_DALPE|nr:hypothetical protein DPEC_G00002700 [Dallia pectoralis]